MLFFSKEATFSFIYLFISFLEVTYPIFLLFIETSYCGLYLINIIAVIIKNATNAIFNNFINSFV